MRAALAATLLTLSACASSVYGPPPAFNTNKDIAELEAHYGSATSIAAYYAQTPETKARRDEFIVGRLTLYNLKYLQYLQQFSVTRAETESAFDISKLAVDISATVAGGRQDKNVLGAISALLTGSQVSIEKNFFDDRTSQALVAQMNAERKKALVPILQGMTQTADVYPLAYALPDLEAYYEAGTVSGALVGTQADASAKEQVAQQSIDQYRNFKFSQDEANKAIFNWLYPSAVSTDPTGAPLDATGKPAVPDAANVRALRGWIDSNGFAGLTIQAFLDHPDLAAQRATVVAKFAIPKP
jgi:hypothetical protein